MNRMPVNNKFSVLLGERSMREKRRIPLSEIAERTKISYPTLLAWASNRVARYDVQVIDKLAKYFEIKTIGELLEYVEGSTDQPKKKKG
jgi:transcriptional regulator with XRE-family HTH domain